MKTNKKQFSSEERKAYYMGVGAAIGFGKSAEIKRVTSNMTAEEKKSFNNGFDDRIMRKKR